MKIPINSLRVLLYISLILCTINNKTAGVSYAFEQIRYTSDLNDTIVKDTIKNYALVPAKGIAFYNNMLIAFSNSRYKQKMIASHISFGQNGTFLFKAEEIQNPPENNLFSGMPFPFEPAAMDYSSGHETLFYTDYFKGKEKIFALKIDPSATYSVVNDINADYLPFCEENKSYKHPAISRDGSFMIFSVDTSGTHQDYDLYLSQYKNGIWGKAVSMGTVINSTANEIYPFLDSYNNLFFSSNGHSGQGGFDIFMCKYYNKGWETPVNLMDPINTVYDDLAFKLNNEDAVAFYATTSIPGKADLLIRIQSEQNSNIAVTLLESAQKAYLEISGNKFALSPEYRSPFPERIQEGEETRPGNDSTEVSLPISLDEAVIIPVSDSIISEVKSESSDDQINSSISSSNTGNLFSNEQDTIVPETGAPEEAVENALVTNLTISEIDEVNNQVIFRVQIVSSSKSKSPYRVVINGESFPTFEYFYKGAYRYTVGDFTDLDKAKAFQKECRAAGFSQAFVAAFINDVRETDPGVFRR